MAKNDNLNKAKKEDNDEFYTQMMDIEKEIKHYKNHFKDKVVYCNCDNCFKSNFFKYFLENFRALGLKKLIATCYDPKPEFTLFNFEEELPESKAYKIIIEEKDITDNLDELVKSKHTILKGEGSFRSDECLELLKEADIVVTNPPFSMFNIFISKLIEMNKRFLVIGNFNAVKYKDIFPLIKENKIWIGYTKPKDFIIPDNYELLGNAYMDENGIKHAILNNVCWYTNLDIDKHHKFLELTKHYRFEDYQFYDDYDAINIDKTADIPCDYDGIMGVPITFLEKFNPDQFEIVGEFNHGCDNEYDLAKPSINGEELYSRIAIKLKKSN